MTSFKIIMQFGFLVRVISAEFLVDFTPYTLVCHYDFGIKKGMIFIIPSIIVYF